MEITKNSFQNLSIFISSMIVCLVLAEYVLRIMFPIEPTIYQADDVLLYKLIPGAKKTFRRNIVNGGERIHVVINSHGFRGEDFVLDGDNKRVVVYGDSFIESEFSSLENTFVKQLEQRLRDRMGEDIEVINAGVVGYGPDQISLYMEEVQRRFTPDLNIVSIFADNDYGDLIRNKIYKLAENGGLTLNAYHLDNALLKRMAEAREPDGLKGSRIWFLLKSLGKKGDDPASNDFLPIRIAKRFYWRLLNLLEEVSPQSQVETSWVSDFLQRNKDEFEVFVNHGDNTVRNLFGDRYDADIALEPTAQSSLYKANLMKKVLERISDFSNNNGTPLLLLIIPSPIDVCHNYDYKVDENDYPHYASERLSGQIENIAIDLGVSYINLFHSFRQRDDNDSLYFRHGDDHWNDKGQAVAANLVAKKILSEAYFRSDSSSKISSTATHRH